MLKELKAIESKLTPKLTYKSLSKENGSKNFPLTMEVSANPKIIMIHTAVAAVAL